MAKNLIKFALCVVIMLQACSTKTFIWQPEMDVISPYDSLQIEVFSVSDRSKIKTFDYLGLRFYFTNRSLTDTFWVEANHITLTNSAGTCQFRPAYYEAKLAPIQFNESNVSWQQCKRNSQFLSKGSTFNIPVRIGNKTDTVRCVMK